VFGAGIVLHLNRETKSAIAIEMDGD